MTLYYLSGLSANLATSATSVLRSSEDANYDADNVGTGWPAQPWRASTAAADDWVGFDFGATKQPTFFSLHGHNLDAGVTSIQIQSATNATFSTGLNTVATVSTIATPTVFNIETSSPTARQYWRYKFVGTNGSAIEIGEAVIGVALSLTRAQLIEWSYREIRPQVRAASGGIPQQFAVNLSDHFQKQVTLDFVAQSYTERNEIRDTFIGASKNGAEPLIVIPDSSDEYCVHGRVVNELTWERIPGPSGGYHRTSVTIDEDPFTLSLT